MRICPSCSETFADDLDRCPHDGVSLPRPIDPLIGRTVAGRYRLMSRLGEGGMSAVYLGNHVAIARQVAVKVLRSELAKDSVHRDRFIREARAVNRINHENIVDITDFGETDDGLVYLVMEYVPGRSLFQLLPRGPFSSLRALHVVEQVASALGRAHQMGVVHRDLKPENILLVETEGKRDIVKLLDFGIAKIFDAPSLTGSQQIFGTPGYIAPEYIQSSNIDGRADLYSLGVILYELVTGALPYDYEYPGDLLVKHVTEPPVPPRERRPEVELGVERLILQCLQKNPRARFRDAYHLIDELRSVRERLGDSSSWGSLSRPAETRPAAGPPPAEGSARREPLGTTSYEREGQERGDDPYYAHVDLEIVISDETPIVMPESMSLEYGVLGVKRWRQRFDVLREALDQIELREAIPTSVAQAIAKAAASLDLLERGLDALDPTQSRAEAVNLEIATLRASLGKEADGLAERLSKAKRNLEQVSLECERARSKHQEVLASVHRTMRPANEADELHYRVAQLDAARRRAAVEVEALDVQLEEVLAKLHAKSERAEEELVALKRTIEVEMDRLQAVSASLRVPLDIAENFVNTWWTSRSKK